MKFKTKKIAVTVLSLVLVVTLQQSVFASTYLLTIPRRVQEKSKWCWAACAKMMGEFYGNNYTQSQICLHVKGNTENDGANDSEVTSAISYATGKRASRGIARSFESLKAAAIADIPCVLHLTWEGGGGHVVMFSGVREADGVYNDSVLIVDPWAASSTSFYGYNALVTRVVFPEGVGKYDGTWSVTSYK